MPTPTTTAAVETDCFYCWRPLAEHDAAEAESCRRAYAYAAADDRATGDRFADDQTDWRE